MLRTGTKPPPIITLTSDFGLRDHYVACMKGVIIQINPAARIVDVTHEIAPHGVMQAAFVLRQIWPWFPPGTIHVAVVDPGVGTGRRILVGRYNDRFVVAPDNGIISHVHHDAVLQELRSVENRGFFGSEFSPTFHGRDVMAPVAAHLASGVAPQVLGPTTDHLEVLKVSRPHPQDGMRLIGEVLYVDRFGNLISNIAATDLKGLDGDPHHRPEVLLGGRSVGLLHSTYGDVGLGETVALVGSTQMLEIAVNQGSAAERFAASTGTPVAIR